MKSDRRMGQAEWARCIAPRDTRIDRTVALDEIPDLVFISETPKVLKRQMELGETGG